jgi:hypothetical protein
MACGVGMTEDHAHHVSRRWPIARLMRVAQLAGMGWSYAEIASDEFVRSTPNMVGKQLHRFGIRVREATASDIRLSLGASRFATFEAFGVKRVVTAEKIIQRAVDLLGDDPALLHNVLDDGK